jgi:FkbM family methyltransferase
VVKRLAYFYRTLGPGAIIPAVLGKLTGRRREIDVPTDGIRHPVRVRVPSSDVPTFDQVFRRREYAIGMNPAPTVIVDAGANVGFASVFFANAYPNARIIAIEPETANFQLLKKNSAPYRNIECMHAALWSEDTTLGVIDAGTGDWGFRTQSSHPVAGAEPLQAVKAISVETLMRSLSIDRIHLFKIDVEGAEARLFADPSAWIGRVDSLIIELHDRLDNNCSRAVFRSTTEFEDDWFQGEHVVFTRRRGCVARRV